LVKKDTGCAPSPGPAVQTRRVKLPSGTSVRSATAADAIALGQRWVAELDAPAVPPEYGKRVLAAYRAGKLSAARTVELLWGTVSLADLPEQRQLPLESLRRELEPLS